MPESERPHPRRPHWRRIGPEVRPTNNAIGKNVIVVFVPFARWATKRRALQEQIVFVHLSWASAYLRMLRRDSGYCGRIRQVHFPVATELRKGPCCADRRTCPSRHSLLKTKLSSLGVRSHFVSVSCQPRADCGVFGCPEGPTAGALGGT